MMEAGYLIIAKVGKLRMASSFRFRWRMRASFPGSKAFLQMGERGQTEHAESRPVSVSIGIFLAHQQVPPGRPRRRTRTKLGLRLAALGGVYRLCRGDGAGSQEE